QNSIYRLGIPYDEGRSLLLRAALERDWPSAAQVIVDAIGTHTLRPRESMRATSLQRFVAQPPTADGWTECRRLARELAEALSRAGREAAARAVWLLSLDPDNRQQIISAHAFLADDASSLVTPDDEVQRTIDNWKILADGHARSDLTDLIAAAHMADGTNAASDCNDREGQANEPPLFVQMALQRTWWGAADLALSVTPDAVPGAVGPWTRGESPHAEIRAVALGLSQKFAAAGQHDLEFLWRLLSIDPSDRVAALWVADELQVLVRAAAIPDDLAWTLEATRATIAWEMLAFAGILPHPNDAFASAWSIYSATAIPIARVRSEQAT
ncbi:hypothetical protein MXD81_54870, partial [Microbacteriaceae bacterium K1510]|nr:hypothetical protein [Microbacteriaceae bacterium K1510]